MTDSTKARQGEYGRRTFLVLAVSTAAAAIIAIAGFLYIQTTPREALDDPLIMDAEVEGGTRTPSTANGG